MTQKSPLLYGEHYLVGMNFISIALNPGKEYETHVRCVFIRLNHGPLRLPLFFALKSRLEKAMEGVE